jgi:hypothetical protein
MLNCNKKINRSIYMEDLDREEINKLAREYAKTHAAFEDRGGFDSII